MIHGIRPNMFQAARRMDEIMVANFMVFHDLVSDEPYDLVDTPLGPELPTVRDLGTGAVHVHRVRHRAGSPGRRGGAARRARLPAR